jgi:hypothetical protein
MSDIARDDAYDPNVDDTMTGDTRSYVEQDRSGGPQVVSDEDADPGVDAMSPSAMDSNAQLSKFQQG